MSLYSGGKIEKMITKPNFDGSVLAYETPYTYALIDFFTSLIDLYVMYSSQPPNCSGFREKINIAFLILLATTKS